MSISVKDIANKLAITLNADSEDNFFYMSVHEKVDANPSIDITANCRIDLDQKILKQNSLLLKRLDRHYAIIQIQNSNKSFIYNSNYDFIRYNQSGDSWVQQIIDEKDVAVNTTAVNVFNSAAVLALPFKVFKLGNPHEQAYTISQQPNSKNIIILITTITT